MTMTLLLVFVFMLLTVAAMSIGVMFGRAPIKGSCGGLAQLGLGACEICGGDPSRCETPSGTADGANASPVAPQDLAYDASRPEHREQP
jgi:hypothetical protein